MRSNQAPTVDQVLNGQGALTTTVSKLCPLRQCQSKVLWQPSALSPRSSGTNQAQVFSGSTGVYSRQKADRSHRRSTSFVPTYMLSQKDSVLPLKQYVSGKLECASDRQCSKSKDNLPRVTRQAGIKKKGGGWVFFTPQVCAARRSHLWAKEMYLWHKMA